MTSKTTLREKGRATFLAALMVLSVVAMSAAFAGGAVAQAENADRSVSASASPGDTVEVTATVQFNEDIAEFSFQDQFDPNVADSSVPFDGYQVDGQPQGTSVAEGDGERIDVISLGEDDNPAIEAGSEVTVTYELTLPDEAGDYTISGDVAYRVAGEEEMQNIAFDNNTVSVETDEPEPEFNVDASAPSSADVDEDASLDVTVSNDGDADGTTSYEVTYDGETLDSDSLDLAAGEEYSESYDLDTSAEGDFDWSVNVDGDDASGTLSVSDSAGDDRPDADVYVDAQAGDLDDTDVWDGQTVAVQSFDEPVYVMEGIAGDASDDDEEVKTIRPSNGWITFDVSDLDEGPHYIRESGTDTVYGTFWVDTQEVDFEFSSDTVRQSSTDLVFESDNRGEAVDVHITGEMDKDGLDSETLLEIFPNAEEVDDDTVKLSGVSEGDSIEADFSDQDVGDYVFTTDVVDSTATDEAAITVEEPVDATVAFADGKFSEEQGDILEYELDFENADELDNVYVTVNHDDYTVNLEVDVSSFDGDNATISWNTHEAGKSGQSFWSDTEDVSVNVQSETSIPDGYVLPTGTYAANLYEHDDRNDRVDTATLIVEERYTGKMDVSIAPQGTYDAENPDDILGELTAGGDVAENDTLVFGIDVSGIYGYSLDGDSFADDSGLSLTFTDTDSPSFADPDSFNASHDGVKLVADENKNQLYAVVQTDEVDELDAGEEWTAEFEVSADNPYVSDGEEETADSSFSIVERMIDLDIVEEPYQVTPTEDAEIHGVTTLAPGSSVNVEVDNDGVFLDDEDVTVEKNEDGDFVFIFSEDYSERSVDEEFEITISGDGVESKTYAGVFADAPEWESIDQVSELQDEIDSLEKQLEGLQDELDSKNATISDLEDKISSLEDDKSSLQDEVSTLEDDKSSLQDEVSSLEEQISTLEEEKATLEEEKAELQDDADAFNDLLDDNDVDSADELQNLIDDDGSDTQPGFGVALALAALLGAAMLAHRRQN